MTKPKVGDTVELSWEDAIVEFSKTLDYMKKVVATVVKTKGTFMLKNKNYHIVMVHNEGFEEGDMYKIPTSLVRDIRVIEKGGKV